eukprot:3255243-Rhodomonas_salina.1
MRCPVLSIAQYTSCGTDHAGAERRASGSARYNLELCCYAIRGTEIGYAAMQCAVLRERMLYAMRLGLGEEMTELEVPAPTGIAYGPMQCAVSSEADRRNSSIRYRCTERGIAAYSPYAISVPDAA